MKENLQGTWLRGKVSKSEESSEDKGVFAA